MRLIKARVQNYRSVVDSDYFEVEHGKTILVGPNEAGKTAILQALQQLNHPKGVKRLDPLRDYPRSKYNDITTGRIDPKTTVVVEGHFKPSNEQIAQLPKGFENVVYVYERKLDNSAQHHLEGAPAISTYKDIKKDLQRLLAHIVKGVPAPGSDDPAATTVNPRATLDEVVSSWSDDTLIRNNEAKRLKEWLEANLEYVEEGGAEEDRYDKLVECCEDMYSNVLKLLEESLPVFVLFNNYFRVRPLIHLRHLADRVDNNTLDDEQYDYGNVCLLKLLGFSARELSELGGDADPHASHTEALQAYRDRKDERSYQLNAASVKLTDHIREVWAPVQGRAEADRLRVSADAQYLKVVVEDSLGVEIELNQRSEGFQWLVSFFVVFFAEAGDKHRDCVLLLDEPGLNLHGLKQRDFRDTISKLAASNQTLYTTHSPFLVGPNELDLVRVVEMTDRSKGTQVHTSVTASDPAALLPLQEALGYDLAQSLFAQQRNLIVEGLTDYWYLDAIAHLLRESEDADLNEKIALVPSSTASKVVYFATILHAQSMKVAALLDSDAAGDRAAQQETLIHTLGNKNILRTKDSYKGQVATPEIEDLLRETIVEVAKSELGWDITTAAASNTARPIVDVFAKEVPDFSKYRLAKAFLRWTRNHSASDLTANERSQWTSLIASINKALK